MDLTEIDPPSAVLAVLSDAVAAKNLKTSVDKAFGRNAVIYDIKTGAEVYEPCRFNFIT